MKAEPLYSVTAIIHLFHLLTPTLRHPSRMIFSKGRIIGLFCTVATLVGAMVVLLGINSDGDLSRLQSLLKANMLLPLLLLYGCHFLAEPLRWAIYAPSSTPGFTAANFRNFWKIFACFNITALLSYSLPFKLGLPLRLFLLSHFLSLEGKRVIKLMVMDSVFTLFCWFTLAALLFLLLPEVIDFFSQYLNIMFLLLVTVAIVTVGLWFVREKAAEMLRVALAISPRIALFVVITLVADILLYGVRHVVLADMLGLELAAGKMFIIGILAVFAGIISTLPMGLGAYDATLVALLALFGVEVELGLILAFSNRLGMIITSIMLGLPSALTLLKHDVNNKTLEHQ
jgi:uncharacterized membrane protein YbhN (UPF0104 family)